MSADPRGKHSRVTRSLVSGGNCPTERGMTLPRSARNASSDQVVMGRRRHLSPKCLHEAWRRGYTNWGDTLHLVRGVSFLRALGCHNGPPSPLPLCGAFNNAPNGCRDEPARDRPFRVAVLRREPATEEWRQTQQAQRSLLTAGIAGMPQPFWSHMRRSATHGGCDSAAGAACWEAVDWMIQYRPRRTLLARWTWHRTQRSGERRHSPS